ncbi:MAG: hypothetical protein ACLPN1_06670 [Dissulfurispiraceae bacterium]|jgi:hypothetical protein
MLVFTCEDYLQLKAEIELLGYAEEIRYLQNIGKRKLGPSELVCEYALLLITGGMNAPLTDISWNEKVMRILKSGASFQELVRHKGKAETIRQCWEEKKALFRMFKEVRHDAAKAVNFCHSLPWIGNATKYILAQNLGIDCAKPNIGFVRLGSNFVELPENICNQLAGRSGDRIATVGFILSQAVNIGVIGKYIFDAPAAPSFPILSEVEMDDLLLLLATADQESIACPQDKRSLLSIVKEGHCGYCGHLPRAF